MENIISSLLNIKELMEDNLRCFDVIEQHLKEWRESHNKMHQVFQQSIEDFTTNIQVSFNEFEAQICEIQEEDVVAVEEKDEIKPAQLFLSYVPKNIEPFLPFSDPSLKISCSSLHVRKYFFSSSFLSVAISNRDPLIKRSLTIIWEFDPSGVDHGLQDLDGFLFCFSCDGERMNSLSFPFHPERTVTHQIYSTMASTTTLYSTTQPVVMHLMLRDSTTAICGPFSPLQPICTISLSLIGLATQKKKSLYYHISKPYDILAAEEALNQSSPPGLEDEKLVQCKISWSHLWGHFSLCYNGQKLVTETDSIRNYGLKDGDQLKFVRHIAIGYNLRKRRAKKRVAWELRGKKYVAPLVLDVLLLRGVFEPFDRGRGRFDILLGFICSRPSQLTLDMKGGLSHSGSHLASTYSALAILKMDGDVRYESSNNSIEKQ